MPAKALLTGPARLHHRSLLGYAIPVTVLGTYGPHAERRYPREACRG